jgi:hypothetical protein
MDLTTFYDLTNVAGADQARPVAYPTPLAPLVRRSPFFCRHTSGPCPSRVGLPVTLSPESPFHLRAPFIRASSPDALPSCPTRADPLSSSSCRPDRGDRPTGLLERIRSTSGAEGRRHDACWRIEGDGWEKAVTDLVCSPSLRTTTSLELAT